MTNLTVNDIQDKGAYLLVVIPNTKTNVQRSFTILNEGFSINVLDVFRTYVALRPEKTAHGRFFLNYRNKKCTIQPVGLNTLSKIPQVVATYLKLENSEQYTGHSLRRSSATLLANAGADITTVKRHGGWKSTTVAEGYIEESVTNKINIARKIHGQEIEINRPSTSSLLNNDDNFNNIGVNDANSSHEPINLNISDPKKTISLNFNININLK